MEFDYIIVKAEGRGEALGRLTKNKPPVLVPIDNCPMLFHLFHKYPDKQFIIIGDYQYAVLDCYLKAFAKVEYTLLPAMNEDKELVGLSIALNLIPDGKAFLVIDGDVVLKEDYEFPLDVGNYAGKLPDGSMGCFLIKDSSLLKQERIIENLQDSLTKFDILLQPVVLDDAVRYDTEEAVRQVVDRHCRPFNQMEWCKEFILKEGRDEQGQKLATREISWYRRMEELGFDKLPRIYSYEPFIMERINGGNIYNYQLTYEEKRNMLADIIAVLRKLHALGSIPASKESMQEAYAVKTFNRLNKVRSVIPFADREYITINGRVCRNIYFHQKEFEDLTKKIKADKFVLIHGDCTFSNIMVREQDGKKEPVLIDPRGYFGYTEMYGDATYDWAKLYYSIVGNFDQFNNKNFTLTFLEDAVMVETASNHWEDMEEEFFALLAGEADHSIIRLIYTIFWLSLTSYAWENYDSICGAFYNGIYYLEELWDM